MRFCISIVHVCAVGIDGTVTRVDRPSFTSSPANRANRIRESLCGKWIAIDRQIVDCASIACVTYCSSNEWTRRRIYTPRSCPRRWLLELAIQLEAGRALVLSSDRVGSRTAALDQATFSVAQVHCEHSFPISDC
jgi:hypothetical protein